MKNNFLRGMVAGFIFTLLISSICRVTFYGLEGRIASSIDVFAINLVFMIVSALIVFFLKKLKVDNKITLISNILLILFGILVTVSIFYSKIIGIITFDYQIPGPIVELPNILWLIVLLCVTIRNVCVNKKYGLLKFTIGEVISVIILIGIDLVLNMCVNRPFHNATNVNEVINSIIQGICGIGIVVYSTYMLKKCVYSYKRID